MSDASDFWKRWKEMYRIARQRKWQLSDDDARDVATEQLVKLMDMYAAGFDAALDKGYVDKAIKNTLVSIKRTQARRTFCALDDNDLGVLAYSVPPAQMWAIEFSEVIRNIELLPEREQYIIVKTGLGYSTLEIAKELDMSDARVQRVLCDARAKIRSQHSSYSKRINKSQYIGVRKQRRKFSASISIGDGRKYLGLFETAKEAAIAYDAAAKNMGRSNLNFPEMAA